MRYSTILTCSLGIAASSAPRPALGQSTDSVRTDSVVARPIHDPRMYLLLPVGAALGAAFTVLATVAPAPIAGWIGERAGTEMAEVTNHRTAYALVGGAYDEKRTRSYGAVLEIVRRGVYGEVRVEDYYRPSRFRYVTARGGYLFHSRRKSAGGVTLGYQQAESDPAQRGFEVGFPLLVGDSTGTLRLDPTYLLSSGGVLWNYRLQMEFYIPRRPYVFGVGGAIKSVPLGEHHRRLEYPEKGIFTGAVTVLLGARF